MAEFQKVMRQWRRMCEKNQADCMRLCPICANPVCGELTEATDEDIRKAEDTIMAWAAEHPEPVYPTWREWLLANRIIGDADSDYAAGLLMRYQRIPADIAQKLGIEPKK